MALSLLPPGCAGRGNGREVNVVAGFYPLAFLASRVGGPDVRVTNLTPPGSEPHDLELTRSALDALSDAEVVLYVGKGFQPGLERALAALDGVRVVDVLRGLPLRANPRRDAEGSAAADPHVWLDPGLMPRIASNVAAGLEASVPSRRSAIRRRLARLDAELTGLDDEFRTGLADCTRREIVTSHAAFGYLAATYGLRQVALTGISPEAEPTPRRLREIADFARRHGVTTIFFESLVSPKVAETVAREAGGLRTAVLDPIEGLSPQDRAHGLDYFGVMRENLRTLRSALDCR